MKAKNGLISLNITKIFCMEFIWSLWWEKLRAFLLFNLTFMLFYFFFLSKLRLVIF